MRLGIAKAHGGFRLQEELLSPRRAVGHEVVDFGAHRLGEDSGKTARRKQWQTRK